MKLLDVPRNTMVRVVGNVKTPPDSTIVVAGDILKIYSLDGAYCFCKLKNGDTAYLHYNTEVEIVG